MTTVLLDTHVLVWFVSEPRGLSRPALDAARSGDSLTAAVSPGARSRGRRRTAASPASAMTAVELGERFPGDPADRQMYATAIERGWRLITKDERLHQHPFPRRITLW